MLARVVQGCRQQRRCVFQRDYGDGHADCGRQNAGEISQQVQCISGNGFAFKILIVVPDVGSI